MDPVIIGYSGALISACTLVFGPSMWHFARARTTPALPELPVWNLTDDDFVRKTEHAIAVNRALRFYDAQQYVAAVDTFMAYLGPLATRRQEQFLRRQLHQAAHQDETSFRQLLARLYATA